MFSELVFAVAEPFPAVASEASAAAVATVAVAADTLVAEDIAEDIVVVAADMIAVEVAEAIALVVAVADMVAVPAVCASMVELVHLPLVSASLLRIPLWRIHRILNIWLSLNWRFPSTLICWLRLPRIHLRLL